MLYDFAMLYKVEASLCMFCGASVLILLSKQKVVEPLSQEMGAINSGNAAVSLPIMKYIIMWVLPI